MSKPSAFTVAYRLAPSMNTAIFAGMFDMKYVQSVSIGGHDRPAIPDARSNAAKRIGDLRRQILLVDVNQLSFGAKAASRGPRTDRKHYPEITVTAARKAGFDTLPSATGGIARLVTARLREAGISPNPLLTQVGLTLAQIDDSEIRVPVESQIRLLELAAEALDDDLLGFHLARDCDLRQLGLVYYVL